jgi:phosphohistidine phosphatase
VKTLTLLRHAKSGWDDGIARDFDRPLNAKGRRAAQTMGRHFKDLGLAWDHVVASPAQRVVETIGETGSTFGTLEPAWDRRIYLASAATLLDVARESPADAAHVLIVGHNPGLEDLALWVVADGAGELRAALADKYPTATLAELRFDVDDWASLAPKSATLVRFIRPRDVDPALGPDD